MAPRIRTGQDAPKPAEVVRASFYPGEVAWILGLEGVDYHQLRRLFRLVRKQSSSPGPEARQWSRFTFRDLVALKVALSLAGGKEALSKGRHLRLKDVERVCHRLREDFGLENPLTEVVLRRRGRSAVARIQGLWFEPASGQMVLTEVEEAVERYLDERREGKTSSTGLRKQAAEIRRRTGRRNRVEQLPACTEIPL